MYLKSIKAHGFKSFAEKIELTIKEGITSVVGPNGSGKSNIVDAVKWVLGEQSIKALRGSDNMTDVIFTGSKSRNGLTRAMVSLTFDNHDHYLNSEFNEIEIKRIVYKTGENEYYINNVKVRLKDITDLFIDSGASKESFNIISQGAVADIINSKPEDRRIIFESAAGVLKYKKRKEEAIRKVERTNDNLEKVNILIEELESSIEPLREQSAVASRYLEHKKELENIEIALIAKDITNINNEYMQIKEDVTRLNDEISTLSASSSSDTSKIEQLKLKTIKLDEEINKNNDNLIDISNKIADLNSLKKVTEERKKYQVEDIKLQNNIVDLKEQELNLQNNLKSITKDIDLLNRELNTKKNKSNELNSELENLENEKNTTNEEINKKRKLAFEIDNKIEIIKNNIETDAKVPYGTKCVINNPRLKGVHGILGKLINTKEKFALAIDTALGFNSNVIVVDSEIDAKDAIEYLKENRLGRATFFPLNIIKGKDIDKETKNVLSSQNGFVGIASDLVEYDDKYNNVVKNQLGNVIIVDDIDALNKVGKLIDYKYRIVTLDGDIQYSGGSISGGFARSTGGIQKERNELAILEKNKETTNLEFNTLKEKLTDIETKITSFIEKRNSLNNSIIEIVEVINHKKNILNDTENKYNAKKEELDSIANIKENKLESELESILEKYYQKLSEKELIEKNLAHLKNQKEDLSEEIGELELLYHRANSEFNKKQNDLKNQEIKLGKMDVKLDNLLLILNETYNITYEKASSDYELETDEESARITVSRLKSSIKDLGDVNLGSIAEYERVNTRYNFLNNQKEDLVKSIDSLLDVIKEMDEIMKERFYDTFIKIKDEFQIVFKKLFKGGEGILKLTDENNLLETGIEIIAEPPGKKLNSIILLSGGEKTLTAIALLFAILNVKPVPFVILDEVEAALDEANVDSFGKYLQSKKDKSQFIIITHKKRTMEYADVLYGITMQESGVSKLVSVELEK